MKRILLMLLVVVASVSVFAQDDSVDEVGGAQRSKYNGVYYLKPTGMMYHAFSEDIERNLYNSEFVTPYFDEFKYVNMANRPLRTYWNRKETPGEEGVNLPSDDEGNYSETLLPGEETFAPYLYESYDHFTMGYMDNAYTPEPDKYIHYIYGSGHTDGLEWLGWTDVKEGSTMNSSADTRYVYGNGRFGGSAVIDAIDKYGNLRTMYLDYRYPLYGLRQDLYAPASPLYIDNVCFYGYTCAYNGDVNDPTYEPLPNGAVLTMVISDQATGEILQTRIATTGDWVAKEVDSPKNGAGIWFSDFRYGAMLFNKDAEGNPAEPFVIDRPITVEITGFDNDDVDIALKGWYIRDCDAEEEGLGRALRLFTDPDGEYEFLPLPYVVEGAVDALAIHVHGVMDKVVLDEEYTNIAISTDGNECTNIDSNGNDLGFGGLYIETALPWTDDEGNANYSLADAPEWVTELVAEEYGDNKNAYRVALRAEKNTGADRTATVHIQCKGYADDTAITISQTGDGTEEGITNVTLQESAQGAGATYNMAGQLVADTTKGLVIKNGKKVINK